MLVYKVSYHTKPYVLNVSEGCVTEPTTSQAVNEGAYGIFILPRSLPRLNTFNPPQEET